MLQAREAVLGHFRPIIAHMGLSEQQWRIIRELAERGELEPREICDICHILSPSVTGVLTRLESSKLVTRRRMPDDQRRVLVRLTPKAEKLVEEIRPAIREQYKNLEKALGAELLAETYVALDRLLVAASAPVKPARLPDLQFSTSQKGAPVDHRLKRKRVSKKAEKAEGEAGAV